MTTLITNSMDYMVEAINNDVIFQLLLASIFIDFLTGISRAWTERSLNSTIGINGLIRHGLVIIITGIVYYFSRVMGADWFSYTFASAFILEYLVSIAENWALSGYKTPDSIESLLDKLPQPDFTRPTHDKNDEDRINEMGKIFKNEGADNNE